MSLRATPAADVPASRQRRRIWLALLAGFGGLLVLMVAMGMDAVFVLGRLHSSDAEMRQRFQRRTRILEQIRSQIYLSGTYVRDYLLAPEASASSAQRLRSSWGRTGSAAEHRCVFALELDAALPSGVRGPVEDLLFSRFAKT